MRNSAARLLIALIAVTPAAAQQRPQVLIVYHSISGTTERMAQAVAEGARSAGGNVVVRNVDQATPADLEQADALIVGSPTHWSNMSAAMKQFIDTWPDMVDRVGGAFSTGGANSGGQEHVVNSLLAAMLSHGMIVAGPVYAEGAFRFGSSGATAATSAGNNGVTDAELDEARALGRRVAAIAARQPRRAQTKTSITAPAGWTLVWNDEFDGKVLDRARWNVLKRERSKHNELQYYLPDEAYVENGILRLRSQIRNYGSMQYTSGRVSTDGRFAPVYGRFEIRARLPYGKGLWPAHWLYPQNRDWAMEQLMEKAVAEGRERSIPEYRPWYSEIDIMEYLGHETNILYGTLHYKTFAGETKSSSGTWTGAVDYSKDFHIYTLEWEPDSLRWFIDGKRLHATNVGIPHTPHYLILNTAVGGAWPGNPDSTTVFPQYHDVDYVRVYQRTR